MSFLTHALAAIAGFLAAWCLALALMAECPDSKDTP